MLRCRNLQEVVCDLRWATVFLYGGLPNVRRVGLDGFYRYHADDCNPKALDSVMRRLEQTFQLLARSGHFPRLRTIKLMGYEKDSKIETTWPTKARMTWAYWRQLLFEQDVSLEDADGIPIPPVVA